MVCGEIRQRVWVPGVDLPRARIFVRFVGLANVNQTLDLELVRSRAPALARTWNVSHRIDAKSPLAGLGPSDLEAQEIEITLSVSGTDETTMQPMMARRRYLTNEIVFGARFADVLSVLPDGRLELDVRKLDKIVPTEPTPEFPYKHESPHKHGA